MKRALVFFVLLFTALPAFGQKTEQKFAHLTVEAWVAKECFLITYSQTNRAHFFLRCGLKPEVSKELIVPHALHGPAVPVAAGRQLLFTVASKTNGSKVRRSIVVFRVEQILVYLVVEPQGRCPAGNFHNKSSEPKSRS